MRVPIGPPGQCLGLPDFSKVCQHVGVRWYHCGSNVHFPDEIWPSSYLTKKTQFLTAFPRNSSLTPYLGPPPICLYWSRLHPAWELPVNWTVFPLGQTFLEGGHCFIHFCFPTKVSWQRSGSQETVFVDKYYLKYCLGLSWWSDG